MRTRKSQVEDHLSPGTYVNIELASAGSGATMKRASSAEVNGHAVLTVMLLPIPVADDFLKRRAATVATTVRGKLQKFREASGMVRFRGGSSRCSPLWKHRRRSLNFPDIVPFGHMHGFDQRHFVSRRARSMRYMSYRTVCITISNVRIFGFATPTGKNARRKFQRFISTLFTN